MKRLWGLRGRLIVLLIVLMIVPLLIFTLLFQRRLVRIMKEDQSAAAGRYESEEVGEGERQLLEEYGRSCMSFVFCSGEWRALWCFWCSYSFFL